MMATVAPSPRQHTRRRPFQWMRRLVKNTSPSRADKKHVQSNNPYPESGNITQSNRLRDNISEYSSIYSGAPAGQSKPPRSTKSAAPTLATNAETVHSDTGASKTGTTSNTIGSGPNGGGNSTFSSPNHSERSLTTTLTTIQSTAPSALLNTNTTASQAAAQHPGSAHNSIGFSPYPASPASAVPAHLQTAQLHPHTYSAAIGKLSNSLIFAAGLYADLNIAGNTLNDDASIMTLASSSKRRRRHSFDTDASVRALAPSSLWGGSRESLPLSVLSQRQEGDASSIMQRPSIAERASVYSSSGIAAPALQSERNSRYSGTGIGTSLKESTATSPTVEEHKDA